ncbi:MAG: hypothetical protein KatS3mg102_0552 [Planctomycetota bacterium]|nr:MAG: hypothetical protein KatS3mg102_0552 [Planctomycetota bacterium]
MADDLSGAEGSGPSSAPGLPPLQADVLYRVYAAKSAMPPLERLLARLTGGNPYNPPDGYVFPPGEGMRRLQQALGASPEYFVMGYLPAEAPALWEELEDALAAGQGSRFDETDALIARNAASCVVIRATLTNPENNRFIETLVHLADAFRDLMRGVVWDVYMRKIWGHQEWREVMEAPLSPLSHVRIARAEDARAGEHGGPRWRLRTHGLRKFGNADLEVSGVPQDLLGGIEALLLDAADAILRGDVLDAGETVEYEGARLRTVLLPTPQGEHPVLRLVDEPEEELVEVSPDAGMPKGLAAVRAARQRLEGERPSWLG